MSASDPTPSTPFQPIANHYYNIMRQYQQLLDRATPFVLNRWLTTAGLLTLFLLRIFLAHGWYLICYLYAIHLLHLLIAFLEPRFDPSRNEYLLADEIEGGGEEMSLPSARDDEFRPFVRKLPEWKFWLSSTRATVVALLCTSSSAFDIPVYWPTLVVYFFVLFSLNTWSRVRHMIKYKYLPFDMGRKTRYGGQH